jgi:hypothetical protein
MKDHIIKRKRKKECACLLQVNKRIKRERKERVVRIQSVICNFKIQNKRDNRKEQTTGPDVFKIFAKFNLNLTHFDYIQLILSYQNQTSHI